MLIRKIPQKIFHHSQEDLSKLLGRGDVASEGGGLSFPLLDI